MKTTFAAIAATLAALALPSAASATTFVYEVFLNGPSEVPPNASPGTGYATAVYDDVLHTLHLQLSFQGLLGNTTASHIHAATAVPFAGTAGVATTTPTFAGFPLGVTSGSYDNVLDLTSASSFNPSYVTAKGSVANAEAALIAAMGSGKAYLNVHTNVFPGGEIRGFFSAVPEPASWSLMIGGFALSGAALRRRHRVAAPA